MDEELAVRALWLAYIGKHTQDTIAKSLNISRQRVQRLIAGGIAQDYMTVQISCDISSLLELEEQLRSKFGLDFCQVAPRMPGAQCADTYLESIGIVGSLYLINVLSGSKGKTIGIGWGRTISHVARQFYKRMNRDLSRHRFVPLMGSLNRQSAMNPMNLIHMFGEKTNAEVYYLPAPFLVDTIEERGILEKQKSVKRVIDLAKRADHYFISIGEVGPTASILKFKLISKQLQEELRSKGAVADILGKFIDKQGQLVDHPINRLSITVDIETLRNKNVTVVCCGLEKLEGLRAVLRGKLISGLITDEETAGRLVS